MKINMTIEEAKKALQKEAKQVRKKLNIDGDHLKVTCNVKQMANGEFTIFSRDIESYKSTMIELGSKYGSLVEIVKGSAQEAREGRIRFKFQCQPAEPTGDQGKDTAEPTPMNKAPKVYKPITKSMIEDINRAIATIREQSGWTEDQIKLNVKRSDHRRFSIQLTNTDYRTEQMELTPLAVLGHVVEINRFEECTEYVFRTHGAPYERPHIKMDLRGLPQPQESTEAEEESREVYSDIKPLAEAKRDILKFADKLRKQHDIPGSDFRIICTDTHIIIGEFILFVKGDEKNEGLRHEFDQFGRCYKIESAGKDATRFRFYYKGTSMYAN